MPEKIYHQLGDTLAQLAESANVRTDKIKLILTCKNCGRQWGVSLTEYSKLDKNSLVCYHCLHETANKVYAGEHGHDHHA